MNKIYTFLIIISLFFSSFIGYSSIEEDEPHNIITDIQGDDQGSYQVKTESFRIDSDADFDEMNISGDGTIENPYSFEGVELDAIRRGAGIYIGNTSAFFELTESRIKDADGSSEYYWWNSNIVLYNVTNGKIFNNTIHGGSIGLYVRNSHNITIENNTLYTSSSDTLKLENSINIDLSHNRIMLSRGNGIYVADSEKCYLSHNEISRSRCSGINFVRVDDSDVYSNKLDRNDKADINLKSSQNNLISHNEMEDAGIIIESDNQVHWRSNHIDENNTLDGRSILFLSDTSDKTISQDHGQIILVNTSNIVIDEVELQKGRNAITTAFSDNITIENSLIDFSKVLFYNTHNSSLNSVSVTGGYYGLVMKYCYNNTMRNMSLVGNSISGLDLYESNRISMSNSQITGNDRNGIHIERTEKFSLKGSNLSYNQQVLTLERSSEIILENNVFHRNEEPISMSFSTSVKMYNNTLDAHGVSIRGNMIHYWNSHVMINNSVSGRPLLYLRDKEGMEVDGQFGQIIITNSTYMQIEDLELHNASIGITLAFTTYSNISEIQSYNNLEYGIYFYRSDQNNIKDSELINNSRGIYIQNSIGIDISNVTTRHNSRQGIFISASSSINITNSNITQNDDGIFLSSSDEILISDSLITAEKDSIYLLRSSYITLKNNSMLDGGINIQGPNLVNWNTHTITDDNSINGEPVLYIVDKEDIEIDETYGQIIVVDCSNIYFQDHDSHDGSVGLSAAFSENITISDSNFTGNSGHGIYFYRVTNSTVINTSLLNNSRSGLVLEYSSKNEIYKNQFGNNNHGLGLINSNNNFINQTTAFNNTYGIFSRSSDDNVIQDSLFKYNRIGNYFMSSDHNVLSNISFENNDGQGLYFLSSYSTRIENNLAIGNGREGLYIRRGENFTVLNGSFSYNDEAGIYLFETTHNHLCGVESSNNENKGISLRYSDENIIEDCKLSTNREYGIYLESSYSNDINSNNFEHNNKGFHASRSFDNDLMDNIFDGEEFVDNYSGYEDYDTILVGVDYSKGRSVLTDIESGIGANIEKEFTFIDVVKLRLDEGKNTDEAITQLNNMPSVRFAEPDYKIILEEIPDDPYFDSLWGMDKIDAPGAWNHTTGSGESIVAVLDTGIDYEHEDLEDNMWSDEQGDHGYNAIDGSYDPMDDHGHGTHVAGTVGAVGNNSIGVTGVNWNVSLMALKFIGADGTGNVSGAVECLEFILERKLEGENVVTTSNSWGTNHFSNALYEAFKEHQEHGILSTAAAGNYAEDNDIYPLYPASFNLTNMISVAATDQNDDLTGFSNFGPNTVHVSAPGTGIYSTERNDQYGYKTGTSMATPHVAGLLGLLSSFNNSLSMNELKNNILSYGDEITSLEGKSISDTRINAYRSITGEPDEMFVRVMIEGGYTGSIGYKKPIHVSLSDGIRPITSAEVEISFSTHEEDLILRDDGSGPDQIEDDGYYSGDWVPHYAGEVILNITIHTDDYGSYNETKTVVIRGQTGISLVEGYRNRIKNNTVVGSINGLTSSRSNNNMVIHNKFYRVKENGLYFIQSKGVVVFSNDLRGGENSGLQMVSSSYNLIDNNNFSYNMGSNIYLEGKSGWNIISNNSANVTHFGIQALYGPHNNTFKSNSLSDGTIGIRLADVKDNNILDNTVQNGTHGLYINQGYNNLIKNNWATYNRRDSRSTGIYIASSYGNKISENYLYSNLYRGIYLTSSFYNSVLRNDIEKSETYGLSLHRSDSNVIEDNNILSNYRGINLLRSDSNVIINNIAKNNSVDAGGGYGIFLSESELNSIVDNIADSNDNGIGVGLYRDRGADNHVIDNEVKNNSNFGIYISSSNNTVKNNNISSNTNGIRLWLHPNNLIEKNDLSDNEYGIEVRFNSENNTIVNNEIFNHSTGLYIDTSDNTIKNNILNHNHNGTMISDDGNSIYNNVFLENVNQSSDDGNNQWDEGDPADGGKGGNYWSDYDGQDRGDGIGEEPYYIEGGDNLDNYPWVNRHMVPWAESFDVSVDNITAGEQPSIVIHDAYDIHGNLMDGDYEVYIIIDNKTVRKNMTFYQGYLEYIWINMTEAKEYEVEVIIDDIEGYETFHVIVSDPEYMKIRQDKETIISGEKVSFSAYTYDMFENKVRNVTYESEWHIEKNAGGEWEDNVYKSQYVGAWEVTGTYGDLMDNAILSVTQGEVDHIEISPENYNISAGDKQDFVAVAYNEFDKRIGDVTEDTIWSIDEKAGGRWDDNEFTSENAGNWNVTGYYEGLTDKTTLSVEPAEENYIQISPEESLITAGEEQIFTAASYDRYDNEIEDITKEINWSIESEAGGSWNENIYKSEYAGEWMVTGIYGELSDNTVFTVSPGEVYYIEIYPQEEVVITGNSQKYNATAFDKFGNLIDDVTQETEWNIEEEAGGKWTDNRYTSEIEGTWTVIGEYEGHSDEAILYVEKEDDEQISTLKRYYLLLISMIIILSLISTNLYLITKRNRKTQVKTDEKDDHN